MMELIQSLFGIIGLLFVAGGFLYEKGTLSLNWIGAVLLTIYASFIGDPIFVLLQVVIVVVLSYRILKERREK